MTINLFLPEFPIGPYKLCCYDLCLFRELKISNSNTYCVWAQGAVDEFRHYGCWYLFAYCLEKRAWTLFYHRKPKQPKSIIPGWRANAYREGVCGTKPEERHFFDLSIGRPMMDYGKSSYRV